MWSHGEGGLTQILFNSSSGSQDAFNHAPFDALAPTYDEDFTYSRIGRAQREAISRELNRTFFPGQRVLEINCGTGIDAVSLAARGVEVLACDISPRMIELARRRAALARRESGLSIPAEFRLLATEEIGRLRNEGLACGFDGAFSNFAGLNCVEDIGRTARDLATLVKPRAPALVCLFGCFCAWEILWYLAQADPTKAFRRLRREACSAELAKGARVRVQYPSIRKLASIFAPAFELKKWRGVGVMVPPTYLESLAARLPRFLETSAKLDRWLGAFPWSRSLADHVLLKFERRA